MPPTGGPKHAIYSNVHACDDDDCNVPDPGLCDSNAAARKLKGSGVGGRRHGMVAKMAAHTRAVEETFSNLVESIPKAADASERLAVMYLHTRRDDHSDRLLQCAMRELRANMEATPMTVYVFTRWGACRHPSHDVT